MIGSLALLYTSQPSPAGSTLIGFDAVRDDGQTISFILYNGSLAAPSGVSLKLQQVSGSFLLVNSDDSIETYNASGKLQTIAHPEGTTKTMGYDANGRLNTVTTNFGHSLLLTYDPQGRLSTVTRQ